MTKKRIDPKEVENEAIPTPTFFFPGFGEVEAPTLEDALEKRKGLDEPEVTQNDNS